MTALRTAFQSWVMRGSAIMISFIMLNACAVPTDVVPAEGIDFHAARFSKMTAIREYRNCVDNALALDQEARSNASTARYLASARAIERCEADLGDARGLAEEERMRAYAVGIQNHVKGGDLGSARRNLERMKQAFPGKDLHDPQGHSFIDTMELVLGLKDRSALGAFASANVNGTIKTELKRARHWKRN